MPSPAGQRTHRETPPAAPDRRWAHGGLSNSCRRTIHRPQHYTARRESCSVILDSARVMPRQTGPRAPGATVKPWQDDQLQVLLKEDNEHRIFEKLVDIARRLGFDYCAYGVRPPLPLTRQRIVMFNNYPSEWQGPDAKGNYPAGDPHGPP